MGVVGGRREVGLHGQPGLRTGQKSSSMCGRSRRSSLTSTMVASIACGVKVTNRPQAEGFSWPGMPLTGTITWVVPPGLGSPTVQ